MKKFLMLMLTLTIAVTLAACGDDSKDKEKEEEEPVDEESAEQANEEVEVTDEEKVKDDEVVVSINDDDIMGEEYNTAYFGIKTEMQQMGQDIEDTDTIKQSALDSLINQKLIMQDADKQGIEATDDEVQEELDKLKDNFGDDWEKVLEESNTTEEEQKALLPDAIKQRKYIEEEIPVDEVSDDEAKEAYEELNQQAEGSDQEVPEYDEIKDELKQQVKDRQKQEQLQAKIEELKESADIEKSI